MGLEQYNVSNDLRSRIILEDFLLIGFTNIKYRIWEKNKKMKGKVKFFNHEKEFGFIIGDDGKDYFVHKSGLENLGNVGK